jgi:hypothetical protein
MVGQIHTRSLAPFQGIVNRFRLALLPLLDTELPCRFHRILFFLYVLQHTVKLTLEVRYEIMQRAGLFKSTATSTEGFCRIFSTSYLPAFEVCYLCLLRRSTCLLLAERRLRVLETSMRPLKHQVHQRQIYLASLMSKQKWLQTASWMYVILSRF